MNNTPKNQTEEPPKTRLAYVDGKEQACSEKEFLFVEADGKLYAYPISGLNNNPTEKPPRPVNRSSQHFNRRYIREFTLDFESEIAERIRQTIDTREVFGHAIPRKVDGAE